MLLYVIYPSTPIPHTVVDNCILFAYVLRSPQWLEVGVMKTLPLLFRIDQVEGSTRHHVIDVPYWSIILTCHSGLELFFQMVF